MHETIFLKNNLTLSNDALRYLNKATENSKQKEASNKKETKMTFEEALKQAAEALGEKIKK